MMENLTTIETSTKVIIIEESTGETTWISINLGKENILELLRNQSASFIPSYEEGESTPLVKVYEEHVFIYKGFGYKKTAIKDIRYLEAAGSYCDIHLEDGSNLCVSMPMREVYEYLPPHLFKRVHRSFVINLAHVDTYVGNCLLLTGGKEITIGREYRENMKEEFVCIGSRKRVREKNG